MAKFKFEEFTKRSQRFATKMRVAVQKRGNVTLNQLAFEQLGEPAAVVMLFDREQRVVGMRPSDPEIPHCYKIRQIGSSSKSYIFGATGFFQYYKLDTSVTREFDPEIEDGILYFNIDQGRPIQGARRKPKGNDSESGGRDTRSLVETKQPSQETAV